MSIVTKSPSDMRATWLVARREIRTRLGSKTFKITTAILLVAIVALCVVLNLAKGDESAIKVATTGSDPALVDSVQSAAVSVDKELELSTASRSDAESQIESGDIDAFVQQDAGNLQVVVKSNINSSFETALTFAAQRITLHQQLSRLGGDPSAINTAVAQSAVDVQKLDPPKEYNSERLVIGSIAGVLIYMALLFTGQLVAQGVVEEKSSRVVEVLLATIKPTQLMAGKVLGIGIVGLAQMLILSIGGLIAASATDTITLSWAVLSGILAWVIAWFLIGYVLFSLVFAASAALVSRQEDVGSVVTPVMMFLVVGYVVGISVLPGNPGNSFVAALSMIPVFSPTLMPMRLAMGGVELWQSVLSVVLAVALIPVLTVLSGKIYRRAIVRTGARIKLGEVLR